MRPPLSAAPARLFLLFDGDESACFQLIKGRQPDAAGDRILPPPLVPLRHQPPRACQNPAHGCDVKLGRRNITAALHDETSGNLFDDRDWLRTPTPLPRP